MSPHETYDVAIVGAGPSGLWAAMELVSAGLKVVLLESVKRLHDTRNISNGFMGGSARSNACFFVEPGFGGSITDIRIIERFVAYLQTYSMHTLKIVKQSLPKRSVAALVAAGITVDQPVSILLSSERLSDIEIRIRSFLERNIAFKPNCTVLDVNKNNGIFELSTTSNPIFAKKCILALGRGGAHWLLNVAHKSGLSYSNDSYDLGIRLEFPNHNVKKYTDKSQTFRLKWDNYRTTAFSVYGSVEMDNIFDIKTSNARSMNNKETCYSSVGLLKTFSATNAIDKVLNLVQIANILADGQLIREPVSRLLTNKSLLSPLEEFVSLTDGIKKFLSLFPEIANNCYLYAPEARLNAIKFKLSDNMETEIGGLYVVGDMSGHTNSFVQAACSGIIASSHVAKNT